MSTKTRACNNCGWLIPPYTSDKKCPMCKTRLDAECLMCGATVPPGFKYCKKCSNKRSNKTKVINKTVNEVLRTKHGDEWQQYKSTANYTPSKYSDTVKAVELKYRGCAVCSGSIEAMYFVIKPKDGGVINEENMWPVCERCLNVLHNNDNPIIASNYRLNKESNKDIYESVRRLLKID